MQGFRTRYEESIREEDNIDWRPHALDYGAFKKRLIYFSKRRAKIRRMLRDSPDGRLAEPTLEVMVGPKPYLVPPSEIMVSAEGGNADTIGYMSMHDDNSSKSSVDLRSRFFGRSRSNASISSSSRSEADRIKRLKARTVLRRLSTSERNEVTMFLGVQLDKVAAFYMSQWQNLSRTLVEEGASDALGHEILELLAFCTMNLLAVRQTLIRFDAFVRTYGGTPMMYWYLKKRMLSHDPNALKKVHHHEELKALMDSFCVEFDGQSIHKYLSEFAMFHDILDHSKTLEENASAGTLVVRDTFIATLRHYFLLGMVEDRLGLEGSFLTMRGKSLSRDMRRIAMWRKGLVQEREPKKAKDKLTMSQSWALALNLLSAFFYCMNYYIVEPSSTSYVKALGARDSVSGALIGMMPLAAMISAVVYSIWSNRSFRQPFIMSSLLMVAGNLVYGYALKPQKLWLALLGRFMTGLGGPKCIVRRYMADTTPLSIRTSVNAAFGMAVAVGSALGPATAILLNKFDYVMEVPFLGEFVVNGMTGPGFFMATIWCIFFLVVVATFGEPARAGLEEQKKLEMEKENGASYIDRTPSKALSIGSESASTRQGLVRIENTPSKLADDSIEHEASPVLASVREDDLTTIFSGEAVSMRGDETTVTSGMLRQKTTMDKIREYVELLTLPVRLCLGLLFAKTFTIEALVSCTSALTRNRYSWDIPQVGTLGCINGLLVVPLSIFVGWLSMFYQDRALMVGLVSVGAFGMFLLIDLSDLIATPTQIGFNEGHLLAVHPPRYVTGYFLTYCSIQAFEGVIGSALSKVIPTALASGTLNSGLLATLVDTLGRTCGDFFIALMGSISLRQLMNLLFIPSFGILLLCLMFIRRNYDALAV